MKQDQSDSDPADSENVQKNFSDLNFLIKTYVKALNEFWWVVMWSLTSWTNIEQSIVLKRERRKNMKERNSRKRVE